MSESAPAINVRGGAGSMHVKMDDLTLAAKRLETVAVELQRIFWEAGRSDLVPAEAPYALASPATWWAVESGEMDLAGAALGLSGRFSVLAGLLKSASASYRAADDLAARVLDGALRAVGHMSGLAMRGALPLIAGPAAVVGAAVVTSGVMIWGGARFTDWVTGAWAKSHGGTGTHYADELERRAAFVQRSAAESGTTIGSAAAGWIAAYAGSHPGVVRRVIENFLPGFVNGFAGLPVGAESIGGDHNPLPHDSGSLTGLVLAAGRRAGFFATTGVEVKKVGETKAGGAGPAGSAGPQSGTGTQGSGGTGNSARAPQTARQLFNRGRATNPAGLDNGKVRVEEYVGKDGRKRFIVYVPGTTKWSPRPGKEGTDLTTNVETVAGDDSVMREAVRKALADSGAGKGDQVALFGFSQGGIVAQSMASDPDFQATYNVTGVMTAGAPTSDFAPSGAKVLAIEHDDDLVPNLDGNTNPKGHRDWTTITVEHKGSDAGNPAASHNRDAYEKSLAILEDGKQPDLLRWQRAMRDFFDADHVATRDYQAERMGRS